MSVNTVGGELHRYEHSFVAVSAMIVTVSCHESVVLCVLKYNSNSSLKQSLSASVTLKSTLLERGCSTRWGSTPGIMPAVLSCETVAQSFVSKQTHWCRLLFKKKKKNANRRHRTCRLLFIGVASQFCSKEGNFFYLVGYMLFRAPLVHCSTTFLLNSFFLIGIQKKVSSWFVWELGHKLK